MTKNEDKVIRELKYSNGTIYLGETKKSKIGENIPHRIGSLKLETGDEIKAIWKEGFFWKQIK